MSKIGGCIVRRMLRGLAVEVQGTGGGDARSVGGGGVQGCRCNEERQWRPEPSLICR